jgi:phosphoribosyl-ATP pyrophosphohydrolase
MTLDRLFEIIRSRKENPPPNSYTARLFTAGEDEIVKKVGEEAVEVILAVKGQGDERVVAEVADLFYHSLVLLAARGLTLADVEAELERRHASPPLPPSPERSSGEGGGAGGGG